MKDYYKILGITSTAAPSVIKNAYRKLAHMYHPDKNQSNQYAAAQFDEIKEAYETLITPDLKEKYLQERWLYKSMGHHFEALVNTPPFILSQAIFFHQKTIHIDAFRVDKQSLLDEMQQQISDETVTLLNNFNDLPINYEIIKISIENIRILAVQEQVGVIQKLSSIRTTTAGCHIINKRLNELQKEILWERYKPALIFITIVIFCIIIALSF